MICARSAARRSSRLRPDPNQPGPGRKPRAATRKQTTMQEFTDLAIFERITVIRTITILEAAETVGIAGVNVFLHLSTSNQGPIVMANDWGFLPKKPSQCFGILMGSGQTFRFLTEMNRRATYLGTELSDMMRISQTHQGEFVWFPLARVS
jgi:hypothetical protein